jgi:hypothetical protein
MEPLLDTGLMLRPMEPLLKFVSGVRNIVELWLERWSAGEGRYVEASWYVLASRDIIFYYLFICTKYK